MTVKFFCNLYLDHARKSVCVLSNSTASSTVANCLPDGEVDCGSSSSSSDTEDDDVNDFNFDPTLIEDRELGFHVC